MHIDMFLGKHDILLCLKTVWNQIYSIENSVDPDQLAS